MATGQDRTRRCRTSSQHSMMCSQARLTVCASREGAQLRGAHEKAYLPAHSGGSPAGLAQSRAQTDIDRRAGEQASSAVTTSKFSGAGIGFGLVLVLLCVLEPLSVQPRSPSFPVVARRLGCHVEAVAVPVHAVLLLTLTLADSCRGCAHGGGGCTSTLVSRYTCLISRYFSLISR
jgi:hypothetical protein